MSGPRRGMCGAELGTSGPLPLPVHPSASGLPAPGSVSRAGWAHCVGDAIGGWFREELLANRIRIARGGCEIWGSSVVDPPREACSHSAATQAGLRGRVVLNSCRVCAPHPVRSPPLRFYTDPRSEATLQTWARVQPWPPCLFSRSP